ncbi:MAG: hypothetical protein NVSMB1_24860 [Polyangiales bacterium]
MTPVQLLRVGLGDEAIHIPLFRLPYSSTPDSQGRPGGFFSTSTGEFGVVIDARVSSEEAQRLVAEEIEKNISFLAATLQNQAEGNKGSTTGLASRRPSMVS